MKTSKMSKALMIIMLIMGVTVWQQSNAQCAVTMGAISYSGTNPPNPGNYMFSGSYSAPNSIVQESWTITDTLGNVIHTANGQAIIYGFSQLGYYLVTFNISAHDTLNNSNCSGS